MSGNTAIVGAPFGDGIEGEDAGAAYVFRFNATPSVFAQPGITRTAGSTGDATIASVSDFEDPAETLTVTATSVPAGITIGGITNSNGAITATVQILCTASLGTHDVTLEAADSEGATSTTTLTIEVSGNTPPAMGAYPDHSVAAGGSTSVTPGVPPSDNGSVNLGVSSSPAFTGTLSVDSVTGIVSIANANVGSHTITVTATDNCDATTARPFTLTAGVAAPTGLAATATSRTTIALSWNNVSGADHYEVIRNSGTGYSTIALPPTYSHIDAVDANTAHVYQVRAVMPSGEMSAYSNPDLATAMLFTDDPLLAGITIVRAVHLTEMRTAVNAVRITADLDEVTFTDPDPAQRTVKAIHVAELRAALAPARTALGLPAVAYSNATLGGAMVRAVDLTELRSGVK